MDEIARDAPEFRTREDVEAWLRDKPREWGVALAARAALRVLPLVSAELENSGAEFFPRVVTVVFRATAIGRASTEFFVKDADAAAVVAAAAASAADAAAAAYTVEAATRVATVADANAGHYPIVAAAHAAEAAARAAAVYAAEHSNVHALDRGAARSAYASAMAVMWDALSYDARCLSTGHAPPQLAVEPLWHSGAPDWAAEAWKALRASLPEGEHWEVWIDWYEARLKKSRWSERKELIYASVPLHGWEQGHVAANTWIYEELQKLKRKKKPETSPSEAAIPATGSAGALFVGGGLQPIDVVADPPANIRDREREQRELYEEMRDLALQLAALERNLLGDLASAANKIVAALPADMQVASIHILWSRVNGARETLAAHDEATKRREDVKNPEPDHAELPLAVAARLRAFVKCYNVFIIGDAKGLELEAQSLGPEGRARTEAAIAAIAPVVADLSSSLDIATSKARDLLQELTTAGVEAPAGPLGDKDKAQAKETAGNFVLQLMRAGRDFLKEQPALARKGIPEGAFREVGKRTLDEGLNRGTQFAEFLHRHADNLSDFANKVWNAPGVVDIIDMFRHLF